MKNRYLLGLAMAVPVLREKQIGVVWILTYASVIECASPSGLP